MKSTHTLTTSHCKIVIDFLRINTKFRKAFKLAYQKMHSTIQQDAKAGKNPTNM